MGPAIPFPLLAIVGVAALLLPGVVLLALGLRGRRISDHPVCRRCRFDLHGVYPARQTCPECGRDLGGRRAVRSGERRRRRWAVAIGALLLLASAGAIGAGGYAAAQGANLNAYKPTWMLAMETRRNEPGRAAEALKELAARIDDGRLGDERIESLVERALAHQADLDQPWLVEWGDLVEAAWQQGQAPQPLYERYLRQAVDWEGGLTLAMRERAQRGKALAVALRINRARAGNGNIWFSARAEQVTVGGEPLSMPGARGGGMIGLGGGSSGKMSLMGPALDAPAGTQPIEVRWLVSVGPPRQGGDYALATNAPAVPTRLPPKVEWTVALASEIEVVAPDSPLIAEIDDPSLAGPMRAAIRLDRTQVRRVADALEPSGAIMFQQPPLPVAFDIYWRAGEQEWKVGTVAAPAIGGYGLSYGHGPNPLPAGFTAAAVDIILRSNPAAAMSNSDITEIWKGELVFEDVEVQWPEPAAAQAEAPAPAEPQQPAGGGR